MPHPMFYKQPIVLDRIVHRYLRMNGGVDGYAFAQSTNSVYIATVEFPLASRHYPIFFAPADGGFVPVALLGLRNDENLFVTDGVWREDTYVPAYVRRYPFVPAVSGAENLTVYIDEAYPGFDADQGQRLFDENGDPTPVLGNAVALLQDFHAETKRTAAFVQIVHELGLLEQITIDSGCGGNIAFEGLWMINEALLGQLDGDALRKMLGAGYLQIIYMHLFSHGRLEDLRVMLESMRMPTQSENSSASMPPPAGKRGTSSSARTNR